MTTPSQQEIVLRAARTLTADAYAIELATKTTV